MESQGPDIPPVSAYHMFGEQVICFNNCSFLEELYVTKNAFFSRHPFAKLGGLIDNFLSQESDDPMYKRKRKVLSRAFF